MPSNVERINAVLVTGAIVIGGSWLASMMAPANATDHESGTTESAISAPAPSQAAEVTTSQNVTEAVKVSADPSSVETSGQTMHVTISGVRNASGNIYAVLFDNPQAYAAYDVERAADLKVVGAKAGTVSVTFTGLPKGAYVVSVFHDENGNQDFDMSGEYPLEGYGTTRADSPYDELSFAQASVPAANAAVQLHYLQ